MGHIYLKSAVSIAMVFALSACHGDNNEQTQLTCEQSDTCIRFTVLHTNDNHGRFWENSRGEYGMAARKTLIDNIRAEVESDGGQVLLLSGGDINTGIPESDLQDAVPDFIGMNLIGYDAMAVGNHEFDNPLSVLDMQASLAEFPMLAANIYRTDGSRYFEPYKIFDINGVKVAVVGLTTDDTVKIGNPEFISELTFTQPQQEMASVAQALRDNHLADIIFATTHMGHYADAKSGSNAPGDVAMARSLPGGMVQAIFGGHSQNPVCMEPGGANTYADFSPGDDCVPDQQNGTWIMQAHEWGKYVGRADFEFDNNTLNLVGYRLIPVNLKVKNEAGDDVLVGEAIPADQTVKRVLQEFQNKGQAQLDEVIASLDGLLVGDRAVVRQQQTNLGRLIALAQSTGPVSADFAVMNSGGVRADIDAGEVTYRDVLTVQPFANTITLNQMSGSDVAQYLAQVATITRGSGGYAQIAGVKMIIDCSDQSVEISEINGKTFNAADNYRFTVPSFNAAGGDGYPVLANAINTGFVDADVLYQFFKAQQHVVAADYLPMGELVYQGSSTGLGCDAQ
ncbi:bifunctional UDP-sugar hydrolase/5'-nucleotidase UshA [Shewanella sp. NIFS-20-20]|uniref:bifunctional UDP-sugar hydrolase/5'-nucleotidase UshA n=1 Tax=Shewanella sp. NIFS-20-20 TaxID=2853806 RepID=UPI001C485C8E|nr:bifunctional UDP-sugar hydrolase/5'-nucleotidase UshA [Shewanella sp. NIFS-20-20]MBV7314333.1 bifunctional UDP-sugar hydrolase/5'-nucleotidase UshA [Shewanella sp. NIFS-20-20]